MIDKLVLLEKMRQFGIDWIDTVGFMDEGQINAVLDIAERETSEKEFPHGCEHKNMLPSDSHGYLYCPDCGYRE